MDYENYDRVIGDVLKLINKLNLYEELKILKEE